MDQIGQNGPLNNTNNNMEQNDLISWLINELFKVDWNPLVENRRFKPMEGHLELYQEHETEPDLRWRRLYFRTKDGRFQWFASHCADEHPISDILLTGASIEANKEEWTLGVRGGKEAAHLTVRVPSAVFEKWHQALLSHSSSALVDAYIQPVWPPVPHRKNRVILLEIGRHAISAGILTQRPSLPLSFFPAKCAVGERADGRQEVVCGVGAAAEAEASGWPMRGPIEVRPEEGVVELDEAALRAVLEKATVADAKQQAKAMDIRFRPQDYLVLLAVAQNIPMTTASSVLKILLDRAHYGFKGVSIVRQPSLVLYSYDVTTGVVVDLGEQLALVPVIDEFVVEDAVQYLSFGAPQIRDQLRKRVDLQSVRNSLGNSEVAEQLLLRLLMEKACYVATNVADDQGDVQVQLVGGQSVKVDRETRFTAPEGLFQPQLWGLDSRPGLHRMVHDAIQKCPIDSRRTLYRNVYLTGGTSLLRGLTERLEHELAQLVPQSVLVQVLNSPWRRHSAYLGAHVLAAGDEFEQCCVGETNLGEYLRRIEQAEAEGTSG